MTHKIIAALAACSMIFAFSSCDKKSEDSKESGKIVKITIDGKFLATAKEDVTQVALGEFILKSNKKGEIKKVDGSTEGQSVTITYNSSEFPVSDVITAVMKLDDSKINDNSVYRVTVSFKEPTLDIVYQDGSDKAEWITEASFIFSLSGYGSTLKGKGTQTKDVYKVEIDKDGNATVTPAN